MNKDIVKRLRLACDGHPYAGIAWPHRLLHEAADEIERLLACSSEPSHAGSMPPSLPLSSDPQSTGWRDRAKLRDMLNKTSVWLLADGKHPINRTDLIRMIEETLDATSK